LISNQKSVVRSQGGITQWHIRYRRPEGADTWNIDAQIFCNTLNAVAAVFGVNARQLLASDPARRAVSDPVWRHSALCRQAIIYILCVDFGWEGPEAARFARVSKQAAHLAVQTIEERREDSGFNDLMAAVERALGVIE
jgi:hypothetical protein